MRLDEIAKVPEKAGFVPYVFVAGEPVFYFMSPSKSEYGGPQPQIAKGGVDEGETIYEGALREAKEELGLKKSNLIDNTVMMGWKGKIRGKRETYMMTVYIGEVKKQDNFKEPHHETGSTHWLTLKEFMKNGRKSQASIVRAIHDLISGDSA